jgi:hypothetical protein
MIEPERPIRAVASWNGFEACDELVPEPPILALCPLPITRLVSTRLHWEDRPRRKWFQRIAETKRALGNGLPANANLFEQGQ